MSPRPQCHSKLDTRSTPDAVSHKSPHTECELLPSATQQASEAVDASLASDVETDDEDGDYVVDEADGFDLED